MDIVIDRVSKSFDNVPVLDNFSAIIPENQTTCIMGESGIGKTTLFNLIAGLLVPDSGTIDGVSGESISMVFQEDRLVEALTVKRNIKLVQKNRPDDIKIAGVLEKMGLDRGCMNKRVSELSGGMKRRVSLARALLYDADLYLFDEPTTGLDEENKDAAVSCIKEYTAGKTVICVTHDVTVAEKLADGQILFL